MVGGWVHTVLFMETTVMEQWLLHLTETPPMFLPRYIATEQKKTGGVASLIVVLETIVETICRLFPTVRCNLYHLEIPFVHKIYTYTFNYFVLLQAYR